MFSRDLAPHWWTNCQLYKSLHPCQCLQLLSVIASYLSFMSLHLTYISIFLFTFGPFFYYINFILPLPPLISSSRLIPSTGRPVLSLFFILMFLYLIFPPQYLQRRQQENAGRQSRGEPPLPEEDINKMFKPPQPPPRMDTLLTAGTHIPTHTFRVLCTTKTPYSCQTPLTGALAVLCNYLCHYLEIT